MRSAKNVVLSLAVVAVVASALAVARAADTREPAAPAPRAGFALKKGFRAVTLKVPADQVVFLQKNDRADVLVTFDAVLEGGEKQKVTATIMQNVGVLGIERAGDKGYVELLLNPNEAQYGILGQFQGELSVIRRAADDGEMKPMEMASFRKLFK